MPELNYNMPVSQYIKESIQTIDGKAWLLVCGLSLLFMLDVICQSNLVPLRFASDPQSALAILLFSPPFGFIILIHTRSLFRKHTIINLTQRIIWIIGYFLIFNFKIEAI